VVWGAAPTARSAAAWPSRTTRPWRPTRSFDQNNTPGREDPATRLVFTNQSGAGVNVARTVGSGAPFVAALPNAAQTDWTITGSNTFELHIERFGANYFVKGVVRQEGRNTADASCLFYGFSIAMT
jgi:hypothetical protein